MNNKVSIPEGLGVKEKLMYRAMMNDERDNLEKRWRYNKTQDLLGTKLTDPMSGEIKVTFDKAKKLDVAFKTDLVGKKAESVEKEKKEEPVVITREDLVRRRANLDMDIDVIRKKIAMVDMMLKEFFGK